MYKFNLAILALVLVLGLAFVGCSNDVKDPAEQAFEDVRKNFGNPKTDSWQQDNAEFTRFFFHEESFISADLQAVRTYWNSLPNTFYGGTWGPDQFDEDFQILTFGLMLREESDGTKYLQIEVCYPTNGKRTGMGLGRVAPEKAMEITQTMVDRVK